MDHGQADRLRQLLDDLDLEAQTQDFSSALVSGTHAPGSLLVVGPPDDEPWHFVAHVAERARLLRRPELEPTWVRWQAPARSKPHLATTIDRLAESDRSHTVVVVAPSLAPEALLERLADTRKRGTRLMAIHRSEDPCSELVHESVVVPRGAPPVTFDVVQHAVSVLEAPLRRRRRLRLLAGR
jgi:hypothetical protein